VANINLERKRDDDCAAEHYGEAPQKVLCLPHPLDTILLEDSISRDDGQLMAMGHDRQVAECRYTSLDLPSVRFKHVFENHLTSLRPRCGLRDFKT